jgi:predicted esterase
MMSDTIGQALIHVGIAALAIDLPMHGERVVPGGRRSGIAPLELMRNWKLALAESSIALRYLAARPEIDGDRLSLAGYSLGSYLGVTVAARDRAVRAIILAAGGDLPAEMPYARLIRSVIDPAGAVRKIEGTPLLMVHGRRDRTVTPEQAKRLFEAAREPKEIRWWDAGHHLPAAAIDEAAGWLAGKLGEAGRRRTG